MLKFELRCVLFVGLALDFDQLQSPLVPFFHTIGDVSSSGPDQKAAGYDQSAVVDSSPRVTSSLASSRSVFGPFFLLPVACQKAAIQVSSALSTVLEPLYRFVAFLMISLCLLAAGLLLQEVVHAVRARAHRLLPVSCLF